MEEDATDIEWVPLGDSLDGMEAEMARGYLEAQGIPVQIRRARQSGEAASVYYSTIGVYPECDLYVGSDSHKAASDALEELNLKERPVEKNGGRKLVYNDDDKLQELVLSTTAPCPICGTYNIQHEKNTKLKGYEIGILFSLNILLVAFVGVIIDLVNGVTLGTIWGVVIIIFIISLIVFGMRSRREFWRCTHCKNKWYK